MLSSPSGSPILLDTHVFVWYATGASVLRTSTALPVIEKARSKGLLRLSPFSAWEIGMLEAKGRIQLSMDCLDWIKQAMALSGITFAPMTLEIAVVSTRLPGEFHGDPADRILVGTARHLNARLATADRKLIEYSRQGFLQVVAL